MKKLLAILLCVVVVLCVGVACTDQHQQGNKDDIKSQIVGTWVGVSEDNSAENYYERNFWAEIKTTGDKIEPYAIDIYEVTKNKSRKLPSGVLYFNEVKEAFIYDGADISQWSSQGRDYFDYVVTFINKDGFKFIGDESDKGNYGLQVKSTYIFERSNMTLEEYENQVKNKA